MTGAFYSRDKGIRDECIRLVAEGWIVKNGGKHTILYTPSKRFKVSVPGTTGGHCAAENFRQRVKRIEIRERANGK